MTYTDNRASRTNNLCVCLSPPYSPPPYPFPSSPVSSSFLTSLRLALWVQLTPLTAYVTIHRDVFSLHCTACVIHPVTPVCLFSLQHSDEWEPSFVHPAVRQQEGDHGEGCAHAAVAELHHPGLQHRSAERRHSPPLFLAWAWVSDVKALLPSEHQTWVIWEGGWGGREKWVNAVGEFNMISKGLWACGMRLRCLTF